IVERNKELGLQLAGAVAELDGVLVRDTAPAQADGQGGRGINAQSMLLVGHSVPNSVQLTLKGVVVANNRELGVFVAAGDATIERPPIRDVKPQMSDGGFGEGIVLQDGGWNDTIVRTTSAGIHESVVQRTHTAGINATGSSVELLAVLVED